MIYFVPLSNMPNNGAWDMQENARKYEWKTRSKIPLIKRSYSVLNIACLSDAYSKFLELEASEVDAQSLLQKDKKRRKRKWVIPEKIRSPPDGWGCFLTPPLTWISWSTRPPSCLDFQDKTPPLPPGFPGKNTRFKFNLLLIENTYNHV